MEELYFLCNSDDKMYVISFNKNANIKDVKTTRYMKTIYTIHIGVYQKYTFLNEPRWESGNHRNDNATKYIYMYKRSNKKWDYWRIIQKSASEDEVNALSRDEEAVGWKVLVIIDVIALPPSLNGVGLLATQLSSVTSLKSVWLLLLDWVLFTGFFATGL